jgi:hypothetical protein
VPFPTDVEIVEVPRPAGRPAGPRFGALVHAVLALTPLGAPRPAVADVAAVQARILAAPPEELAAAIDTVAAAFDHPLLRAAAAAGCAAKRRSACSTTTGRWSRRHRPRLPRCRRLDGLVDYKTDVELSSHAGIYSRRSRCTRALSTATAVPARATTTV